MARGLSLHIGVGSVDKHHYCGWSGKAPACESDAQRMQALAKAAGFSTTIMKTKDVIADHVLDKIKKASEMLQSGDIFLLTFAGHGASVPDINGDENGGEDDVWVCHDRMLIDDELYALWSRFQPKVRIVVISDSCTNGTVISVPDSVLDMFAFDKVEHLYSRAMPRGTRNLVYEKHKCFYDGIQLRTTREFPASTILLLASSQDGQPSFDNGSYGIFTNALIKTWNNGNFSGQYADLFVQTSNQVRAYESPTFFPIGAPNPTFPSQKAFLI